MEELELNAPETMERCIEAVQDGLVVAASLDDQLYVLFGNGRSAKVDHEIRRIKGGERGPLSVWLSLSWITKLIDRQRLSHLVWQYLKDEKFLTELLGGRALIRYQVCNLIDLPPWIISHDGEGEVLQQFSFQFSNPKAFEFQRICAQALGANDLPGLIGVTSMNQHNEDTITEPDKARDFCRARGVELLIHKGGGPKKGSYPLLIARRDGFTLDRYGSCSADEIRFFKSRLPNFVLADLGARQS